ncbi:hypothetical protein [Pseudoalteromonas sp. R86517]|uniref:hypothetical protein n=1 Tax=Pseudoalteromonas sp. R86517 TaxID=3093857 RepID=UPI00366BDA65
MTKEFIRNCSWGYSCDQKWEKLSLTHNTGIRFCGTCEKEVYRCETQEELAENITLNRCVNFSSDITDIINTKHLREDTPKRYTGYPASLAKEQSHKPSTQRTAPANNPMLPTIDFDDDIPF